MCRTRIDGRELTQASKVKDATVNGQEATLNILYEEKRWIPADSVE
jgi:hypothetical protein